MNRRLPNSRATVRLTGGADAPRTACADRPEPYDVLIDLTAGPGYQAALREARSLCGSCPLAATCLRVNREEPWARAVLEAPVVEPSKPRRLPADVACGTESGYKRHRRLGQETCEECRAAQAAAERRRSARRRTVAA